METWPPQTGFSSKTIVFEKLHLHCLKRNSFSKIGADVGVSKSMEDFSGAFDSSQ